MIAAQFGVQFCPRYGAIMKLSVKHFSSSALHVFETLEHICVRSCTISIFLAFDRVVSVAILVFVF